MAGNATPKPKNKGGRPPIEIDLDKLESLALVQASIEEIAAHLGCGVDVIYRRRNRSKEVRRRYEKGRLRGKLSVRQMLFKQAAEGKPGPVIFLAKNLLGYRDDEYAGRGEEKVDKKQLIPEWLTRKFKADQIPVSSPVAPGDINRSPAPSDSMDSPNGTAGSPGLSVAEKQKLSATKPSSWPN